MIRTLAVKEDGTLKLDIPIEQLKEDQFKWYWVDFNAPKSEEINVLRERFDFHLLSIEDCLHHSQRPKLDYYADYHFLVVHALKKPIVKSEEVNLFIGNHFLVTFHYAELQEIDEVWKRAASSNDLLKKGPMFHTYKIIDKLVDTYFPYAHRIEDQINEIESKPRESTTKELIDQLFQIRKSLSNLRRTVVPMSELLYRLVHSERFLQETDHQVHFQHVYHHLIKLSNVIEMSREVTSDIRDNYISLNSFRMNSIMMTLTVISSIFIPLTFIAGIYGMNFDYMPELRWRYGYFLILGIMFLIGFGMFSWLKVKGWFNRK